MNCDCNKTWPTQEFTRTSMLRGKELILGKLGFALRVSMKKNIKDKPLHRKCVDVTNTQLEDIQYYINSIIGKTFWDRHENGDQSLELAIEQVGICFCFAKTIID